MSEPLTGIQANCKKYYKANTAYLQQKAKLNYQQNQDKQMECAKLYRIKLMANKKLNDEKNAYAKLFKEKEKFRLRKLTLFF